MEILKNWPGNSRVKYLDLRYRFSLYNRYSYKLIKYNNRMEKSTKNKILNALGVIGITLGIIALILLIYKILQGF